jgi:hypothetical protein
MEMWVLYGLVGVLSAAVIWLSWHLRNHAENLVLTKKILEAFENNLNACRGAIELLEKNTEDDLKNLVSKDDATYKLVLKVLDEAGSQGEGLFLVRRLEQGTYLWKVDQKDVIQVHPSQLKRG